MMTDEQEDEKECQEAFEKWGSEIGLSLEKDPILNSDNQYDNRTAWILYKGWKAAWKSRAGEYEKGFNSGIDTVMTVLDEDEPDDRVRQIKDSIRDSINEELDLMASDG